MVFIYFFKQNEEVKSKIFKKKCEKLDQFKK